ncbi:MAG: 50S ribosomal protein L24 [Eubacteriales bacterium]|nr:50S ribosomal protein L24 [Eubacteriales bacterium]
MKVHVKVNDNVYVLSGKDKGKSGKVLRVVPEKNRVFVEGVNIVTKHKRPDQRNNTGGIIHQEASINASNVMLVCPKCKRPAKTGRKFNTEGEKVRYCKACDATIDVINRAKNR